MAAFLRLLVLAVLVVSGATTFAQTPAALLGASGFQPSPDSPFGWRGDGTGRFPGATPPTEWSAQKNVRWSALVGGSYSSPILARDLVLVTSEPNLLICLSRADGKERWRLQTTPADLPDAKNRTAAEEYQPPKDGSGMAAATPITDGANVYIVFANGIIRDVGLDGTPKWITFIDAQQNTAYGRSSSPIIAAGKLIVHMTNLYAFDPASGRQIWVNTQAPSGYGTPLAVKLAGVDLIITPAGDVVRADDGKSVNSGIGLCNYTSPIASGDSIYFAGTPATATRLDAKFKEAELFSTTLAGDIYSSPLLHDGVLYIVTSLGQLSAFDTKGTDPSKPLIDACPLFGATAYASVTLAGHHLFINSTQGDTIVLEATREARQVAKNTLPAGSGASPVFSGKDLFLRDGDHLLCIGN